MQVIGLCRFSYPAIGGFQIEHSSIEERVAYLYAEARLEERFRLFETLALPCLREQTDPDFDLIVVIGDSLPPHHEDRLRALVADMPQVQIRKEPPRKQREVMKELLNQARRDPAQPCLQFRHDDDDAISVDFVERLRATVPDCPGLFRDNKTVAVDFPKGFIAEIQNGELVAAEVFQSFTVAALGMYVRGNCPLTIMNFAHHKLPRFMPALSFSDAPMWVRSHNGSNDSRQGLAKSVNLTPLTPEQIGEFEARFAIRADHVASVFR